MLIIRRSNYMYTAYCILTLYEWPWWSYVHRLCVERVWNLMAHGDTREGKWRGNWRMEWVASTLHTTSEHGISNITTADAHTSAAISRLNWRPRWFKWTRPFRRKMKSSFCACAITFQLASTIDEPTGSGNRYLSDKIKRMACDLIIVTLHGSWALWSSQEIPMARPALQHYILH